MSSDLIIINYYHLHCPVFEMCWTSVTPYHKGFITLLVFIEFLSSINSFIMMKTIEVCKSFTILTAFTVSCQYKFLYDEEDYRIVQWLHYINCTHRVSVLEFPLLGIDSMTKATLVKANI